MYTEVVLKIDKDFSHTPGPRYRHEGDRSGEEFREDLLVPVLRKCMNEGKRLCLDLDGVAGYGMAFLDEAFGGLVKKNGYTKEELDGCMSFISHEEPYLIDDIHKILEEGPSNLY